MSAPAPDRSGHLELDGRRVWWERFGAGRRDTVCLLNGLAMHTKAWYGFLPRLVAERDVLLFDYLGQGGSSAEDEPCSIPAFAGHLAAILDHLEIARVHLMGISYGGFVALDFARLHGERLQTLTLSGALLSHEELFSMYQELSLAFYRGGAERFDLYTRYLYEKIFSERFVRRTGRAALDEMRRRFFERYAGRTHCLVRLTEAQDPFFAALDANLPGYRAVAAPALVLAGGEDRAIPPWVQRKLSDVLPRVRFEEVAGCGHVVYLEEPDRFFGDLLRFTGAQRLDF